MRRLLILALSLLSLPAFAQPSVVQSRALEDFNTTTVEIAFSGATTAGNTVIVSFTSDNASASETVTAVTDDDANTYGLVIQTTSNDVSLWCFHNVDTITNIFGTVSTAHTASIFAYEVAGLAGCTPQELTDWSELSGGGFQVSHTMPYVTTAANEFVVGIVAPHANLTISGTSGTTALTFGTNRRHSVYKIPSSAESGNLNWDWGGAGTAHGTIASFPAAAGGGSIVPIISHNRRMRSR